MKKKLDLICASAKNISIFQTGSLYECQLDESYCPSQIRFGDVWYCGKELRRQDEQTQTIREAKVSK